MRFYAKLPSQVVALSLIACLVVVGAPALVSVIDDTLSYEHTYEADLDPDLYRVWARGGPEGEANLLLSYIVDPVDSSIITVVFPVESDPTMYTYVEIYNNMNVYDGDVRNVKFTITGDPTSVLVNGVKGSNNSSYATLSDGVFSIDVTTIDNALLSDSPLKFQIRGFEKAFTVDIDVEKSASFAYGEIIIGLSGIVLMLCALFATPWFGVKGYTGKKFWRR